MIWLNETHTHTHSQIQVIVISCFLKWTHWFRSSFPWVQKDYFWPRGVAWPSSQHSPTSPTSAWHCGEGPSVWRSEERSRTFLGQDCLLQKDAGSPRTGLASHGCGFHLPKGWWSFRSPPSPSHHHSAVHQHSFNVLIQLFLWMLCMPDHKIYRALINVYLWHVFNLD